MRVREAPWSIATSGCCQRQVVHVTVKWISKLAPKPPLSQANSRTRRPGPLPATHSAPCMRASLFVTRSSSLDLRQRLLAAGTRSRSSFAPGQSRHLVSRGNLQSFILARHFQRVRRRRQFSHLHHRRYRHVLRAPSPPKQPGLRAIDCRGPLAVVAQSGKDSACCACEQGISHFTT